MSPVRLRAVCTTALLAVILPVLAACGGPSETANPTAAATAAATASPQATAAPPQATTAPPQATAAPPQATAAPDTGSVSGTDLEPGFPMRFKNTQFGIVNHLYYTDRERVLTLNSIAGFEWVRQQVVWKDIEGPNPGDYAWGELDLIIADVTRKNQKLLVSIVRSPAFYEPTGGMPSDPVTMGNFVEAMATRYGDQIAAYEIWNEPNLQQENGGRVVPEDAGTYVELLVESYKRIKTVSPGAFVIAAPASSTGVNEPSAAVSDEIWYRTMYTYKDGIVKDYFDAQGVHPGGAANPPDTLYPENPSVIAGCVYSSPTKCWNDEPTHYFRHLENVRRFMVEEGVGDHQMWITEYGWSTPNNTPGYEFGNYVDEQQQADYIIGAMRRAEELYRDEATGKPWIGAMFLWNMNYAVLWQSRGDPMHEQATFGIINNDYSPRPSFNAIQGYLAQLKQQRSQ
ncbi:MAG: hypothetical protein H7Z42_01735 [Roseiflexaceae bacterium]|nr:hypothetical protein [Roseiflexaceae bacterium]